VDIPSDIVPSLAGVVVLTAITTAVLALARVPRPASPAIAILRGAVQLAVLSVILTGVITSPIWIALALVVMFAAASAVATGRTGRSPAAFLTMATSIAAGVATTLVVVFATGALAFTPRYVLAIGAIIIGNAMSMATLTGRLFTTAVVDHWDEVEGWLALGATPRQSTRGLARRCIRDALIPGIDQTRTTGLVVLPGAFVGAIFGGISPVDAGRFQIVVLAGIMAAGSITSTLVVRWMGAVRRRPAPLP